MCSSGLCSGAMETMAFSMVTSLAPFPSLLPESLPSRDCTHLPSTFFIFYVCVLYFCIYFVHYYFYLFWFIALSSMGFFHPFFFHLPGQLCCSCSPSHSLLPLASLSLQAQAAEMPLIAGPPMLSCWLSWS